MLKKLQEEDFAVLRGPFESGRQSPASLGGVMIPGIFLQSLFLYLEFNFGEYSIYPFTDKILFIHLWGSVTLALLSILYAFPFVYNRSQKVQYLLSIIYIQNLGGVSMYILMLMLLGDALYETPSEGVKFLITFTYITLTVGILVFIATCIRFLILLQKGKYRKGSTKDKIRSRFETKSYLPIAIIAGTGMVFITQFLFRNIASQGLDTVFLVTLSLLIFYTMIFVLPEQLVILYCKYRFQNFNFRLDGRLYPFSFEEDTHKDARKKGRTS